MKKQIAAFMAEIMGRTMLRPFVGSGAAKDIAEKCTQVIDLLAAAWSRQPAATTVTIGRGRIVGVYSKEFASLPDGSYPLFMDPDGLIADYEEQAADHRRLVRELDVLLNGEEGAAKQASLCDIVGQVQKTGTKMREKLAWPGCTTTQAKQFFDAAAAETKHDERDMVPLSGLAHCLFQLAGEAKKNSERFQFCERLGKFPVRWTSSTGNVVWSVNPGVNPVFARAEGCIDSWMAGEG